MSFIEWNDALSVGLVEMDDDHKKLVGIVNTLNDVVTSEQSMDAVSDVLDELISYTQWHFRHEERLMQQFEYPDYFDHKQEHEKLVNQAVTLAGFFDDGDHSVPQKLLLFLKDWLEIHIQETDSKTGQYLAAHM